MARETIWTVKPNVGPHFAQGFRGQVRVGKDETPMVDLEVYVSDDADGRRTLTIKDQARGVSIWIDEDIAVPMLKFASAKMRRPS